MRSVFRKAERVRCSGRGRKAGSGPSLENCKLAGRNLCLAQTLDPISAILLLKGVKKPGAQSPELLWISRYVFHQVTGYESSEGRFSLRSRHIVRVNGVCIGVQSESTGCLSDLTG